MSVSSQNNLTLEDIEQAKRWVYNMYNRADNKDISFVRSVLKEEAVLNLAAAPPLRGIAALEGLFLWEYGACGGIQHSIQEVQVYERKINVELSVKYSFKNGAQQVLKYIATWHKSCQESRASRVDIEGDFSQVFQELSAVGGPPPL